LLSTTTSYPLLLVIAATLLGTGFAAFPQLFALARSALDREGPGSSARGTPALRSVFSLAWAVGPAAGAGVAPPPAVLGFGLFYTAAFSGSVVLPLYVTGVLDRPAGDVGLMFSVCALVEVPASLALMLVPGRISRKWMIQIGMGLLVGYFALIAAGWSIVVLLLAQVVRGLAYSAVSVLGITYFQDLLPDGAGRATTVFANTAIAGSLASGIIAGATAQAFGYRAALVLCGLIGATGLVLLAGSHAGRVNRPT
jgi:SET family sugar efflux transporter-like MFS transporter